MSTIYFTSDIHFGHEKLRSVFEPDRGKRWTSTESMNSGIIDQINERVSEEDTLWHLGDLTFTKFAETVDLLSRIRCHDVNFLLGNHDSENRIDAMVAQLNAKAGFDKFWVGGDRQEIDVQFGKEKQMIVLDHYPLEVWNKSHYGSWHLHGHCHGKLPRRGKRADAGLDSKDICPGGLTIHSLSEVKAYMDKQEIYKPY